MEIHVKIHHLNSHFFLVFNKDFVLYAYFTHIEALSFYAVMYYVIHIIFNSNSMK